MAIWNNIFHFDRDGFAVELESEIALKGICIIKATNDYLYLENLGAVRDV